MESVDVPQFDALPLIKLNLFLQNFYSEIVFKYAEFDICSGYIKLHFQSDKKSFNDFKKQIHQIEEVELILDDRAVEPHSQNNNEDEKEI